MPSETDKKRIYRWVDKWRGRLLLQAWTVDVEFMQEQGEDATRKHLACVVPDHRYLKMTIELYPLFWEQDDGEKQRTLAHEMIHTLTDRVQDLLNRRTAKKRVTPDEVTDAIENLVEHFSNVVWCAYKP